MKCCGLKSAEIVAVLIAVASLVCLVVMLLSELHILSVDSVSSYEMQVLPALQDYAMALGIVLLIVSVSHILIGRQEDVETILGGKDKK